MYALWFLSPIFCLIISIYRIYKNLVKLFFGLVIDIIDYFSETLDLILHIVYQQLIVETTSLRDFDACYVSFYLIFGQ